ncbi:MAG: hypothetical protein EOO45_26025 [Flavobacterium sp.]|nr:MAG: hypothetical protein EOO45_26025 [Flavobacterium sp.]
MKKLVFFALILIYGCSSTFKGPYPGIYGTRYSSYGMFSSSIELKIDSTFIKHFRGDMMNDYSYGKWSVKYDTLLLSFDTIAHPNSRYKYPEYFIIKSKRLTQINLLTAELKKRKMWDTLSPKYKSKAKRLESETPIDFKGTMRKNYYKLIE